MITIAGTENAQYKTDPAPAKDEWDSWVLGVRRGHGQRIAIPLGPSRPVFDPLIPLIGETLPVAPAA